MTPDDRRHRFLEGVRLFNAGAFFEAHEAWEDAWRDAAGVDRSFLQGLIQCAVALEHYRRGNARGAATMARRYPPKFRDVAARYWGVDVTAFLDGMRVALAPVADREPGSDGTPVVLDYSRVPRIVIEPDGATGD
jgi:hypothetical protein